MVMVVGGLGDPFMRCQNQHNVILALTPSRSQRPPVAFVTGKAQPEQGRPWQGRLTLQGASGTKFNFWCNTNFGFWCNTKFGFWLSQKTSCAVIFAFLLGTFQKSQFLRCGFLGFLEAPKNIFREHKKPFSVTHKKAISGTHKKTFFRDAQKTVFWDLFA